jgi:acyl dehydratase
MPAVFDTPSALLDRVGEAFAPTDWVQIDQKRVDLFAEATGDHQWIHVDPVRAKDGPFGGTVAHGYLTLSMVNLFLPQLLEVRGMSMGVNYGCGKVRFPAPVRVGSRIRGVGKLASAEPVAGGVQAVTVVTIEVDGQDKPGCVVETISRYYAENA